MDWVKGLGLGFRVTALKSPGSPGGSRNWRQPNISGHILPATNPPIVAGELLWYWTYIPYITDRRGSAGCVGVGAQASIHYWVL